MSTDRFGNTVGAWVRTIPPYRITLHGPLVEDVCVDCGSRTYSVQPTGRIGLGGMKEDDTEHIPSRCSTHARKHNGVDP